MYRYGIICLHADGTSSLQDCMETNYSTPVCTIRPYLRTGPRGPGPGRQIFRGGILKKSRLKYGMRKKKGCLRERNLREIYTETMLVPSGIAGIVELINCIWKLN